MKRTSPTTDSSRKRSKVDDPNALVLFERYDFSALSQIRELELPESSESLVNLIHADLLRGSNTRRLVSYQPSPDYLEGRLYGRGLQGLPSWIRRILTHTHYCDIDIHNCAPTLISQIFQKCYPDIPLPRSFERYVDSRAEIFEEIRTDFPHLTDKELKKMFLKILHGGGLDEQGSLIAVLLEFEACVKLIIKMLVIHPSYSAMFESIEEDPAKSNTNGTFISHVWQKAECEVILSLKSFLESEGCCVGCLAFDGVMLEKGEVVLDAALLRRAEEFIFTETNFRVSLVEKSLVPTAEDWERFYGPKALNKIQQLVGKCIYLIERAGQVKGLKRMDGHVLQPHKTIPGVHIQAEEDLEFINSALQGAHGVSSLKVLQEFFNSVDSARFPLLTRAKLNNNVIAFTNGFFDIQNLSITRWDDWKEAPPLTEHFFDSEIIEETHSLPTPLWDQLLLHQMDPDCRDVAEVLIGRLFYPIGQHDNWQVMPFLLGDANTGKGSLLDLIKAMFPRGSVGCITASKEATFGLESLIGKRLVQAPDLPKRLRPILAQTDFQSLVSGEQVTVARKNQKAISNQNWTVPMVWAANQFPEDYTDASGSVSRRLVVFKFLNLVAERDTQLKEKIIKGELVSILIRCILAYRAKVLEVGARDFWSCVPQALIDERNAVKEEANYLQKFLANGSSACQVVHEPGATTTLMELEKAYTLYMEKDEQKTNCVIGADHFPIKNAGYMMLKVHLCKICGLKASKSACGDHYDARNRCERVCILDMSIVKAPLDQL
jgi:hypothetical protein